MDIPPAARWLLVPAILLLLGLPVLSGFCFYQTVNRRKLGDEALSRSYADATKSFVGMMVASWVMLTVGWWGLSYVRQMLEDLRNR